MATPVETPANFGGDRQPALYGTLVTFLVLNNLAVAARFAAHYRAYYRKGGNIFLEDVFVLLSGVSGHPPKRFGRRLTHRIQGLRERCYR